MNDKQKRILLALEALDDKTIDQSRPRERKKNPFRIIAVAASLVIAIGLSLWIALSGTTPSGGNSPTVDPGFAALMKDYLLNSDSSAGIINDSASSPDDGYDSLDPNGNYMEVTDNQIDGVVEGDVIKATDKYVFRLGAHTISIYSVMGEESSLVSSYTIPFSEEESSFGNRYDMFLSEDGRTITLFTQYENRGTYKTVVMSVDVSDVTSPKEKSRMAVSGYKDTVRRIDGKFYLITNCYFERNRIDLNVPQTFIPSIEQGEEKHICDGNKIIYPDKISSVAYKYLTVFSEDLTLSDEMAMMVSGSPVFTENSIVFEAKYYKSEVDGEKKVSRAYSKIGVLDISDKLEWRGDFTILGWTRDRYSIDEKDGALRIVASVSDRAGYRTAYDNVSLYVYDVQTLKPIASVERFAPEGEAATAVRFEGDNLYVCTAETVEYVDPVYFFDLSDYGNITYTHTGFINGFSTSLIDMGEGYLLGVGREDESHNKLEVYKREGDSVISVNKFLFGGSMSTDYKSFMINRSENLFGVYVEKYTKDGAEAVNSYLVLRLDDEKLVPIIEIPETVYSPRAFVKDGFLYLTNSNALYVREIFGNGSCNLVTKHVYGQWEEITPAPCGGYNVQQRSCSCGRVETQRWKSDVDHKLSEGICTLCGENVGTAEKNAELIIYTSNGDGTCTVTGTRSFVFGVINIPTRSPEGEEVIGIGQMAFERSNLDSVNIPSSIRFIDKYAFYACPNLKTVSFKNDTGGIIDLSEKEQASSLTVIGASAFAYCESLEEIIIPDSVTEIGEGAFESCKVLERVRLPKSLTRISRGLFNICHSLGEVTIPDSVTVIDNYAFNFCIKLKTIKIPDNVTSIGTRAFGGCENLFSVELGSGVLEIADNAFEGCDSMIEVVNKSSLEIIAGSDSHGKIALNAVSVTRSGGSIVTVGDYIFHISDSKKTLVSYTGSDTELCLPDCPGGGEYEIGNRVFKSMREITSVHIPAGVTAIGIEAFRECYGLKSLTLPDSVKVISEGAFLGCGFTSFDMGNGVMSIGRRAFRGCGKLESISMSESLEIIGDEAFSGCYKVDLDIPSSVKTIGYGAFSGCFELSRVVIPDGVTVIENKVFDNCQSLVSVVIPDSVVKIKDAFYACPLLESIYYKGTEAEWNKITLDYNNGLFIKVKITYNFN